MNLNKLNIIWRNVTTQKKVILNPTPNQKRFLVRKKSTTNKDSSFSSSSSSSSDSDNDVKTKAKTVWAKTVPPKNNEETMTKLNNLLLQIIQNDAVAKTTELKLARPKDKRVPKQQDARKVETNEKKLVKAVGEVAKDIGGATKQTESELLTKLLSPIESTELSKSLNDIMKGMKIDREPKSFKKSKAEQVKNILQSVQRQVGIRSQPRVRKVAQFRSRPPTAIVVKNVDLFGAEPMGIFTNKNLKETNLKTWQTLFEKELNLAITHPPANYFQEMILWTEQGKLWKFPIDNEQGLEAEKQVDFSEHIFLEEHLESWCTPKGPIRHFMELVCVGLSKNPYLTVEAKMEHIEWFKNYFEEKKKLLQEVGAFPTVGGKADTQIE